MCVHKYMWHICFYVYIYGCNACNVANVQYIYICVMCFCVALDCAVPNMCQRVERWILGWVGWAGFNDDKAHGADRSSIGGGRVGGDGERPVGWLDGRRLTRWLTSVRLAVGTATFREEALSLQVLLARLYTTTNELKLWSVLDVAHSHKFSITQTRLIKIQFKLTQIL